MASNYSFSVMPSVSISRSRFERKSQHKTTFNLGIIVPIYVDEVLPGDTRSFDMAALVRMSTPIAPIMDNIYLDYFAFFVPNRLTWDHWKEFQGENNVSAGIPASSYSIPVVSSDTTVEFDSGSYGDYFGLPVDVANLCPSISALPFRALALIYNRWFRNENIIAPLAVNTGDTAGVLLSSNSDFIGNAAGLLKASKLPDYFTKALPYAQKGTAVSIPLGTYAPVIARNTATTTSWNANEDALKWATQGRSTDYLLPGVNPDDLMLGVKQNDGNTSFIGSSDDLSTQPDIAPANLWADLSTATAATINQLRYAFQLQKLLEKDALYGTRYWEILAAHFGVTAPDASLQDPEYLGGKRMNINIDQVLSQSGYTDTDATTVGKTGANSVSGFKGSLFTKSFVEHGYIIVVAVARHDQTYGQGINRMWTRKTRYDFYMPVFANLGAQSVLNKEIFAQGTSADDDVFGYQEAWSEYRYKPSICTSLLRPGVANNLGFWTLSNNFDALPTLGQTFIQQGRGNLGRALVTSTSGPDFIADFYFRDVAVRPMPVYSVPGLIDHH